MLSATPLYKYLSKAILVFGVFILSGCATQKVSNISSTNALSELNAFQVNGRLAIMQPEQKQSAYFYWQQNQQDYKLTVNTFLGINLFTAKRDSQGITISTSEQNFFSAFPQQLLYELTGWWLPLDEFGAWLKADLSPKQGEIAFYQTVSASTRIKTFKPFCQQLSCPQDITITYKDYRAVEQLHLPFSIDVVIAGEVNQRIRIKIKEWL